MKRTVQTLTALALIAIAGHVQPAHAFDQFDFLVRGRLIVVDPAESGGTSPNVGDIQVDKTLAPEVDLSFFVTKNIAFELIAASTRHNLSTSTGIDLGSVRVLPPTLLAQYHFFSDEIISPYIGVGVNYTWFFDETNGPTARHVDVKNSWGYAFQAGFDLQIPNSRFVFNMDAKKIFLSPQARVRVGSTTIRSNNFDLDPWVFGAGFGYRF